MTTRGHGEGTIHHRQSDGRWVAGLSPGSGQKRRWFYGPTRKAVEAKLSQARRELAMGTAGRVGAPRLEQFVTEWLRQLESTGRVRSITAQRYRQLLELHILPGLGLITLDKLRVEAVQRVIDEKAKSLSPQTVRHIRAALRTALNAAMRRELIGRNVAALAEVPALADTERGFLSPAQARQLLAAVKGDRLEVIYSVGIALGLRPAEIRGLRWSDIDFESARLQTKWQMPDKGPQTLSPLKTRASRRTIDLPDVTVAALLEHRSRQQAEKEAGGRKWNPLDLVITSEKGGAVDANLVRRHFRATLAAAGLPTITLYDATRHSCASLLAGQNIHPKVAQRVLGHAQFATTMNVYSHVAPESMREAADAIDRALGEDASGRP